MVRTLARRLALAIGLTTLAACSSTPSESVTHADQASTAYEPGTFDNGGPGSGLQWLMGMISLRSTDFELVNGNVVYTMSPVVNHLFGPPDGGVGQIVYPVPTVSFHPDVTGAPTFYATLTAVSVATPLPADVVFTYNNVQATAHLSGSVHVGNDSIGGLVPSGDLVIDNATITATLSWNPTLHVLHLDGVTADVQDHIDNCGAFGWCTGIANGLLPSLSGALASAVKSGLSVPISATEIGRALPSVFEQWWNYHHKDENGVTTPWSVAPGSVTYSGGAFRFDATRFDKPVPPAACSATPGDCGGSVGLVCSIGYTDPVYYQWQLQPGTWGTPQQFNPLGTTLKGLTGSHTIRFCATNSLGTSCAPPQTFMPSTVSCMPTGSGCNAYCANCESTSGTCIRNQTSCRCIHQ